MEKRVVTLADGSVKYQLTATSGDPHGTIVFRGCNDVISWSSSVAEDWNGFTFGVLNNRNGWSNAV